MGRAKRTARGLSLAAVCGLWALAGAALAVDVRGSVRAAKPKVVAKPAAVREPYWEEWNGFLPPKPARVDLAREVAVVLVGNESARDAVTIEFVGGALKPSTVVVEAGSTLRLRNRDDFAHRLYAEGLEKFDPVATSAGQMREIRVLQTGNFPLLDALAPHVRGHLHVLAKVTAVATPRPDGSFVFEQVNPGNYTLKVFYGPDEVSSEPIEVKDKREFVIDPIIIDNKRAK